MTLVYSIIDNDWILLGLKKRGMAKVYGVDLEVTLSLMKAKFKVHFFIKQIKYNVDQVSLEFHNSFRGICFSIG